MEFWIKAAQLLLSLSILVVLHEFGHYIPARLFKTRVEKFYLFFNYKFSLFKKKIGETEWGIGWIPLGGYVKIAGMIDESMDKDQMKQPAKPWEFRSKPAWQRLIIMTGGVIVNLLLGMLIYVCVIFAYGEDKIDTSKLNHGMAIHPFMEQYGLVSGDNIIAVDGEKVYAPQDVTKQIMVRGGRNLKVKHQDGSVETIKLPEHVDYNIFKKIGGDAVFDLRFRNKTIGDVAVAKYVGKDAKFSKGLGIEKIDGKPLSEVDVLDNSFRNKGHKVTFKNTEGDFTVSLNKKEFQLLLWSAPALSGGLLPGDEIVAVNGNEVQFYDQITTALQKAKGEKITVAVNRGGERIEREVTISKYGKLGFGGKSGDKIQYADKDAQYHDDYSFGASIGAGISQGYWTLHDYVAQMKFIFTEKGATSLGGFGAIGNLFAPTWNWKIFWERTALISIILAFMNILPIPALDGGHVVFLLYEMITGREAPEKVLEIAQYVGLIIILGLVLYANGNDIYRFFFS
ncbi:MAG: site-2 protease family protein [bacterium]|nr:site-2 protease family protein [bacterium]